MNTVKLPPGCPRCGSAVPTDAPGGLCPRCVLLGAATLIDPTGSHRISPPSRERLQEAFPQMEILEFIGQGGMGFVYSARQRHLDRRVALKILPVTTGNDPTFVERFIREGRLLARLNHPNIVAVYDFGQTGDLCYLVMEFVDGVNLRQAMRSGRFSPREALAIVPRICEALQYAHEQGVLHRDIKPENILLDAAGRVKIADFGIAKLVGDQTTDFTLTASGVRLGTPHYMAPEQVEAPSDVDHRADIYSLGVVFYELLTGELPLGRFAPPSAKADLDARIDEIVLRALAKERELRQQSAGEVKTQVEDIQSTPRSAGTATPAGTSTPTPTPPAVAPVSGLRLAPEHQSYALLGMGALLVILLADALPLTGATVGVVASSFRSGPLAISMALASIGFAAWLGRLAWMRRNVLLEPFGVLQLPGPQGQAVRITASTLYGVLAARLILQSMAYLGLVFGSVGQALQYHPVLSLVAIIGLTVAGLFIYRRLHAPAPSQTPAEAPSWMTRAGGWFVAAGLLSLVPTVLSWNGHVRVWTPGSWLAVVGLALLTRNRMWRTVALAVSWPLLVGGIFALAFLPVLAGQDSLVWPGVIQDFRGTLAVLGWLEWAAFVAAIAALQNREVKAACGIPVPSLPATRPNPWPHRLFWLIVGTLLLVGSATITGFLVPALQRGGNEAALPFAPLIPFATGALIAWLYRRTRPSTASARPEAEWSPWPKRIFISLVLLVFLPALLFLGGLLLPRLAQDRHARGELPPPELLAQPASWQPPYPHFIQTPEGAAFSVDQEGSTPFVVFFDGLLNQSSEDIEDPVAQSWTNRGILEIPGKAQIRYERRSSSPELLLLGNQEFQLEAGRLFVMDPTGRCRQVRVTPSRPEPESIGELRRLAGFEVPGGSDGTVPGIPTEPRNIPAPPLETGPQP